jgi:hypothetical protein
MVKCYKNINNFIYFEKDGVFCKKKKIVEKNGWKARGISSPEVPQLNSEIFLGYSTIKPEIFASKLTQTVQRRSLGSICGWFR